MIFEAILGFDELSIDTNDNEMDSNFISPFQSTQSAVNAVVNNVYNLIFKNKKISDSNTQEIEANDTLYRSKEREWEDLVGEKNFKSLDIELRNFLINTAGMIDLGFPIDIKKAYKYSIFDDE